MLDDLELMLDVVKHSETPLNLYALADAAQNSSLPLAILGSSQKSRCLFSYDDDAPIAKVSPHLVELDQNIQSRELKWIKRNAPAQPCVTLMATTLDFEQLFAHFAEFLEVTLPGKEKMFLAFWDPMILAALIGQPDDQTLHVKGPIYTVEQLAAFLNPISHGWYWDREAKLHAFNTTEKIMGTVDSKEALPLTLAQEQVDMLVELSVPDHVLQHIRENQPGLLIDIPEAQQYNFIRNHLADAREWGLKGMGDLLNYCSTASIYGPQFKNNETIRALLGKVKAGALSFDEAMDQFPPVSE